jgi:hypothetical protein
MSVGTVRGGLGVAAEYMMRIVNAGLARPRPVTSLVGHVTYSGLPAFTGRTLAGIQGPAAYLGR